jgi:hypothetical protein
LIGRNPFFGDEHPDRHRATRVSVKAGQPDPQASGGSHHSNFNKNPGRPPQASSQRDLVLGHYPRGKGFPILVDRTDVGSRNIFVL